MRPGSRDGSLPDLRARSGHDRGKAAKFFQAPDSTAVWVALWRAMHVEVDPAPHVLHDTVGLRLVAPDASWRDRPDMHPLGTRGFRAAIVGRARFVEDLVDDQA